MLVLTYIFTHTLAKYVYAIKACLLRGRQAYYNVEEVFGVLLMMKLPGNAKMLPTTLMLSLATMTLRTSRRNATRRDCDAMRCEEMSWVRLKGCGDETRRDEMRRNGGQPQASATTTAVGFRSLKSCNTAKVCLFPMLVVCCGERRATCDERYTALTGYWYMYKYLYVQRNACMPQLSCCKDTIYMPDDEI